MSNAEPKDPDMTEEQSLPYLIWSNEHQAWWRPFRAGYTMHLAEAGQYSRSEAITICADARGGWVPGAPPPEIPVAAGDALEIEGLAQR